MRSISGGTVAVLAVALVWLTLLAFPVGAALSGTLPPAEVVFALAALLPLVVIYVGTAATVARRGAPTRAPLATAVVCGVAVLLPVVAGPAWFGATVYLAAFLGLTQPARRALSTTAAVTGLAVVQAQVGNVVAAQALAVPLVTAVAGVVVVVVVRQVALTRELAASRREVALTAALEERLRLARELHDSVKQQAFVAALELGSARARLGVDPHLEAAAEAVGAVQRRLGEVIQHLGPGRDAPEALVQPLRREVASWSRRTGVRAELAVDATADVPAEPLLTVAGEALTNIARHSGARHVRLALQVTDGTAQLVITDDGRGFDPAVTRPGQGLRGMAERLAHHRGGLDVRSGRHGTTITARVPHTS